MYYIWILCNSFLTGNLLLECKSGRKNHVLFLGMLLAFIVAETLYIECCHLCMFPILCLPFRSVAFYYYLQLCACKQVLMLNNDWACRMLGCSCFNQDIFVLMPDKGVYSWLVNVLQIYVHNGYYLLPGMVIRHCLLVRFGSYSLRGDPILSTCMYIHALPRCMQLFA